MSADGQQCSDASTELVSLIDFIRYGASRFAAAGLSFGHGCDNAVAEARALVLHALHLQQDLPEALYRSALTMTERREVLVLFRRRIEERVPAAYLIGEAWFAGLPFFVDANVLVPRSPLAELIEQRFEPWVDPDRVAHVLDLCTGSGCIAIACAVAFPAAQVVASDISSEALAVATRNRERHHLEDRVSLCTADVYSGLPEGRFDLIVSNPPYVPDDEYASLPPEFVHEPALGLRAGADGLAIVHRILAGARERLNDDGVLVVEVGNTWPAVEQHYAHLPLTWLDFERGGDGVFLMTARDLDGVLQ